MIYSSETTPIVGYKDRVIEGFVDANLSFRDLERMRRFLVFGQSGDDLYVFDTVEGVYGACDNVSLEVFDAFPSFDEMMAAALRVKLPDDVIA